MLQNIDKVPFEIGSLAANSKPMFLKPTTPEELNELAKSLRNKYSSIENKIRINIIKLSINKIISYLINNQSINYK